MLDRRRLITVLNSGTAGAVAVIDDTGPRSRIVVTALKFTARSTNSRDAPATHTVDGGERAGNQHFAIQLHSDGVDVVVRTGEVAQEVRI